MDFPYLREYPRYDDLDVDFDEPFSHCNRNSEISDENYHEMDWSYSDSEPEDFEDTEVIVTFCTIPYYHEEETTDDEDENDDDEDEDDEDEDDDYIVGQSMDDENDYDEDDKSWGEQYDNLENVTNPIMTHYSGYLKQR